MRRHRRRGHALRGVTLGSHGRGGVHVRGHGGHGGHGIVGCQRGRLYDRLSFITIHIIGGI